ncbi:MAG: DMT family transporter [Isosphaeraceae bacterium]|nr:DMT family transporter [Isosphaeraceae bacterium]
MPPHPPSRRLDLLGVAGTVLCCALWGGNSVAVKAAISDEGLPALGCATMRFVISLPIVYAFCLRKEGSIKLRRRDLGLYLFHGLITAIQIGTYNWGTSRSEAGRSSVFINIHPLVVAPLAWWLLGERLGRRGVLGLLAAAGGVAVILYQRLMSGGGLVGDVVVLISGLIFGTQTVTQKMTFARVPPATLLLVQTVLAIPITLAASIATEPRAAYHFTPEAIGGLLYQGLAVSGLCFSLWMFLLDRYPAGRLATIAFLTPLFGIAFGNLARGESLNASLLVGGVLVGSGIYLVATGRGESRSENSSPIVDSTVAP